MSERSKIVDENTPFSFPVKVGHVSTNAVVIKLEADDREKRALAKFWNVIDVTELKAKLRLSRWKRDGVRISGEFTAKLVQNCVVSLLPINTHASEEFVAHFVPETSKLARRDDIQNGEIIIDVDGPDIPDTFTANTIDIAQVVTEYVAMAIDPYPRDPEVEIDNKFQPGAEKNDEKPSPFAILASIKDDLE
tara:strand:+ start:1444 stop:2019 length:576 start_codon:yes stop_codon:yes gene_type:complete